MKEIIPAPSRHRWGNIPPIRRFRRLGRTGLEVSDIFFGSSRTTDPDLVSYALERGVNYFDTAEGYKDGRSEETLYKDLVDVILCGYNFGQAPSFHQRFTARLDWVAVDVASCLSCALRPCLGKCPQGLEIPRLTRSAQQLLGARF